MHSPSAALQSASYLPEGNFYTSGVRTFTSGDLVFVAATQADHLSLVARAACVPGSHQTVWTVTIKVTVLASRPPGRCTGSRLKHAPSLSVEEASPLSWSFGLRDKVQVWPTSRVSRAALRDRRLGDAVFTLSLRLAIAHRYLPERSLYTHLELVRFLRLPPRRHLQMALL